MGTVQQKAVNAVQPQPDQMPKDNLGGDSAGGGAFSEFLATLKALLTGGGLGLPDQTQGPTMPNSTGALMPPGNQPNPLTQISLPQNPLGGGLTAPPPAGMPSAMIGGDNQNPGNNMGSMASMVQALSDEGVTSPAATSPVTSPLPEQGSKVNRKDKTGLAEQGSKVSRKGKGSRLAAANPMDNFLNAIMGQVGNS